MKTTVACRTCNQWYTIPGEFTERRRNEASTDEWKKMLKAANQSASRHVCKPANEESEDLCSADEDGEASTCRFDPMMPSREWTVDNLHAYFATKPENPPTLLDVEVGDIQPYANPKINCTFRHPKSGLLIQHLALNPAKLAMVPAYDAHRAKIKDMKTEKEACKWVHELFETIISTVEWEKKYPRRMEIE